MASVIVSEPQYQGSSVPHLFRVLAPDGEAAQQADISAATLKVYLKSDPNTPIAEVTLTVSTVFFDTLQDDALWDGRDSIGYNFKYWSLPAHLPKGGQTYIFEFKFTYAANSEVTYQQVEVTTIDVFQA